MRETATDPQWGVRTRGGVGLSWLRLRAHFSAAGLDGERPLAELLETVARVARAEQRRLEPTSVDRAGNARAALKEVRQRLVVKANELEVIAERADVGVRTLYRIRKGRSVRPETLERLARELEVDFENIAYLPPELTDVDEEYAAAALQWAVEEWAREQNERALAGEEPTGLDLCKLGRQLSPDAVQTRRSQHPERWPEPPFSTERVRLWKHRAVRALESA